jgi:hypothetical protein
MNFSICQDSAGVINTCNYRKYLILTDAAVQSNDCLPPEVSQDLQILPRHQVFKGAKDGTILIN